VEGGNYCENEINTRKAVTVTVNGALTPGAIGTAQAICYNTPPAGFTQTTAPTGGTGTYTYQWQNSPDNSTWTNITGATAATYAPGQLTANTYYRRAVTSGTCGTVYSASILITVNPAVTVNAIADKTACAGTTVTATAFTSPTSGATFSWANSNPSIGLAAGGTGNLPQFTAAQAGEAIITVTPIYNGCNGKARTFTIRINPCVVPVNPHLRVRTPE
jgi:hypothetical protein